MYLGEKLEVERVEEVKKEGIMNNKTDVNNAYEFRKEKIGVIRLPDLLSKHKQHSIKFYAEHIEARSSHQNYYAIWVGYYTEEEIGKETYYNKIYKLIFDNKPAVIFIRIDDVLNPPFQEGDVFTLGLAVIRGVPNYALKIIKKHGTFVPHIQDKTAVYQ